jgi:Gti1/Pac2 family
MSSPPEEEAASNADNDGSGWPEPPWSGWIETTGDALLILEAARRGLIPRVTRRLVDSERKMITSGSVFVFDEDESGIKRWTDGFIWSPSRILGNFLVWLVPVSELRWGLRYYSSIVKQINVVGIDQSRIRTLQNKNQARLRKANPMCLRR